MSIKIMSAVFETEFTRDFEYEKDGEKRIAKASTAKLVLLAIADHCNDDGQAYPGLTRLEVKTALSRQGICDTIEALKYNGILEVVGTNEGRRTNIYQINLRAFSPTAKELPDNLYNTIVKPLDHDSQATLPSIVKPLDLNHQLTINNLNVKSAKKDLTKKQLDQADQQVKDMVEYSKKSKTRTDSLLPEQYQSFAKAFTDATGVIYLEGQQAKWIGAFETWHNLGVTTDDIKDAAERLSGVTIYSPMSLTNTLNATVAERKRRADNDPYKNFNWIE